jgi:hypothetical protein
MNINFRKSLKLIALLITSLLIATASAVAYVTLTWTTTATVVANPAVCFVDWSDGTTKANTFTYTVNIFPNIKTVDENITYGIWNNVTSSRNVYLCMPTVGNSSDITSVYLKIYNATSTIFTYTWVTFPNSTWTSSITTAANTKYSIWTEIQCASGATVSDIVAITYEMKVENP